MRNIKLSSPSLNKDWSMQFMDENHYDNLLDDDVTVLKPDGSPLLVLLKKAMDPQITANAWAVLKKINIKTENRSTSSGISAQPRKKTDGTYSKTTRVPRGWEVVSGIIGSFERTIRAPYAHKCSWNAQNPDAFLRTVPLFQQSSELFKKHVPKRFEVQNSYCMKTHPDWVIPKTV